MTSVTL